MSRQSLRFISKAQTVHGNKYDYSKSVYTGVHNKLTIICPTHGEFDQRASNHLSGYGCKKCANSAISSRLIGTLETFISKAQTVHGNKYDYSKSVYTGVHNKLTIICPTHGEFDQTPNNHTHGKQGCAHCAGVVHKDTVQFVEESRLTHGAVFDYTLVEYVNAQTPVAIICPTHGVFEQTPTSHLCSKTGCPMCGNKLRAGRYTTKTFEYFPHLATKAATLYVVEFKSPNEQFIKVGICTTSIKKRFNMKLPYQWCVVDQVTMPLVLAVQAEHTVLTLTSLQTYTPAYKIDGHTECREYTALDTVLNTINTYKGR